MQNKKEKSSKMQNRQEGKDEMNKTEIEVIGCSSTSVSMYETLVEVLKDREEFEVTYREATRRKVDPETLYIVEIVKEGKLVGIQWFPDRNTHKPYSRDIDRVLYDMIGIEEHSAK